MFQRGLRSPSDAVAGKPARCGMNFTVWQVMGQWCNLQNGQNAQWYFKSFCRILNDLQLQILPFGVDHGQSFPHQGYVPCHETIYRHCNIMGRHRIVQKRSRNDLRADAARISWRDGDDFRNGHEGSGR